LRLGSFLFPLFRSGRPVGAPWRGAETLCVAQREQDRAPPARASPCHRAPRAAPVLRAGDPYASLWPNSTRVYSQGVAPSRYHRATCRRIRPNYTSLPFAKNVIFV